MERLAQLRSQLQGEQTKVVTGERLRIRDNRTGRVYEVALK